MLENLFPQSPLLINYDRQLRSCSHSHIACIAGHVKCGVTHLGADSDDLRVSPSAAKASKIGTKGSGLKACSIVDIE